MLNTPYAKKHKRMDNAVLVLQGSSLSSCGAFARQKRFTSGWLPGLTVDLPGAETIAILFFPPTSAAQCSRSHTITINDNKCSDSSSSIQPQSTPQVYSALPRKSPSSSSEEATSWKDSCGYRMETVLVSCHQKVQARVRSCNSSTARSLLLHYCLLGEGHHFPVLKDWGRMGKIQDSIHVAVCPIHHFYNSGHSSWPEDSPCFMMEYEFVMCGSPCHLRCQPVYFCPCFL